MQVDSTTAYTSSYGNTADGSTRVPSKSLDQNDFLKLLVTQMTSQDPMNPESNTDMAAQMAQFTSLQQTSAMSSSLNTLQAASLIGRNVTIQVDSKNSTSGTVDSVQIDSGTPKIVVGGVSYDLSKVTSITPQTTPASTAN
ncbi:MAG TPA: flagellar hook capping FlgD N-terminal domain-containing protein [Dongiaceae bacterium]|nr:flagellar hook capping FlgD N-terminal domain-containing protein [Dongiaceae bacterium]